MTDSGRTVPDRWHQQPELLLATPRSTRSRRRSPREFDKQAQIELQQQADKILWDDFYGVTIFQFPGVTAYSDRVTNIDPSILAPTIFWNAWDWEVTDAGTPTEEG